MSGRIKIQWLIWSLLTILVLVGTSTYYSTFGPIVPVKLKPGETVELSVFRPFPDALGLGLRFSKDTKSRRPELGVWTIEPNTGPQLKQLNFKNPGEPIKIKIHINGKDTLYEALPVDSGFPGSERRPLITFVDDGNPNQFSIDKTALITLPSGITKLKVTVIEIGEKLFGEEVSLTIDAPIQFKFIPMHLGYRVLWWFMFWPVYSLLLLAFGALLLKRTLAQNRLAAHPER